MSNVPLSWWIRDEYVLKEDESQLIQTTNTKAIASGLRMLDVKPKTYWKLEQVRVTARHLLQRWFEDPVALLRSILTRT